MKAYIKFRHPDAIYLLDQLYDLREIVPPKTCGKCGENLHVPIDGDFKFAVFDGSVIRGHVLETVGYPPLYEEEMTIIYPYRASAAEQIHLETMGYTGLLGVEEKHIHLSVYDVSKEPIRCTVCFPKEEPNLCEYLG